MKYLVKNNNERKKCPKCKNEKLISSFVTIYGYKNPRGKYCKECFLQIQQEHVITLMEGRDYCLYCGKKITRVYDWTKEGKSSKTYLNLDHMDPLYLGGKDSDNNTVFCCVECNLRKGKKSFVDWLKIIEHKYSVLSRKIYIKKHKRLPEEFPSN